MTIWPTLWRPPFQLWPGAFDGFNNDVNSTKYLARLDYNIKATNTNCHWGIHTTIQIQNKGFQTVIVVTQPERKQDQQGVGYFSWKHRLHYWRQHTFNCFWTQLFVQCQDVKQSCNRLQQTIGRQKVPYAGVSNHWHPQRRQTPILQLVLIHLLRANQLNYSTLNITNNLSYYMNKHQFTFWCQR